MKNKDKLWIVSSNSQYGWIREGEFSTKREAETFIKRRGMKSVGLVDYEIWKDEDGFQVAQSLQLRV